MCTEKTAVNRTIKGFAWDLGEGQNNNNMYYLG